MSIVGDYMEDRIKISILMDYYKELLTDKQKDIMELYYNQDLSLSEISELTDTSRQAIHDLIKRCNKLLIDYEYKLKLVEKSNKLRKVKDIIIEKINRLEEQSDSETFKSSLQEIKNTIVENI
ncbi:putative DNA-binding protein [Clostridium thermopalmarium DSM 5974]|uniref:UPF0122 protein CLCOL_05480 n=3 Tax=Clostridiaceae TaxID=31979 RepID=A0A151AQQ8_9CLOT|nr:putative DNA-binding protein [Clostridium colicanis DSM 13634]PRR75992.1 putative DNA-binding protein [Clostridium thermopalmarium DSM 5974]